MTEQQLSKPADRPAHIPESAVFDFDMFQDPAYKQDPHGYILDLLEQAPPVFWTPRNGGHWIALSYDANFTAARNPELFSSEVIPHSKLKVFMAVEKLLSVLHLKKRTPMPFPILLDPPRHTKYRQPLQSVFSPKNVKDLEQRFRNSAIELIDQIAADGHCEFMSAIAEPLPVRLFLQLFGLPVDKLAEYRELFKKHMSRNDMGGDSSEGMGMLQEIAAVMRPTFLERRKTPKDDIISYLWQTEIDDRAMTLDEMENYGALLFIAGLDTVMQSMGYGIRHLANDQQLQQTLRDEPERIGDAIEDTLRCYSFALPVRRITRDVEFQGLSLKKDESIHLFLHGANLDKNQFPNPSKVDINRENKAHIAFNAGPHRCLGSHLARMELRVLYEEFLSRVPTFRLDPDNPPMFECGHIVGVETLHLVWDV